jgi:hypothetical protein
MSGGTDTQPTGTMGQPGEIKLSKGTVPERRALIAARKERARARDAQRVRLTEELAQGARYSIPRGRGFLVVPPGELGGAARVIEETNELIDSIGHERLMSGKTKGGFIAKDFVPESAKAIDSPYLRLALDDDVIRAITAYLGVVPVLTTFNIWYSAHGQEAPKSSQLWHLDPADTTQIKMWVHCSDVGPDSGPLTIVDAATSDQFAERVGYRYESGHYRVGDDEMRDGVGEDAIMPLTGETGTVGLVDTSRCFHFGSRVSAGATPRRMVMFQYLTPYAFEFVSDHRDEAPLRGLATDGSSELDRLVLGAA